MDNRIFGVRPYPECGESYQGFFLRLAWLNGLPHLKSLFETIGVVRSNEQNIGRWSVAHFESVCMKLAPFLNRSPETVIEPFRSWLNVPVLFDQMRMIQDLRLNHPRICPLCLAEGKPIHQHWALAITAHCTHHQCQLLDHCPNCSKPFAWKSSLLDGCEQCGLMWSEHQAIERHPSPLECDVSTQLIANEYDRNLIKDLCYAIVVTARPFDSMYQPVDSVGLIQGYSLLVARAFSLLTSIAYQKAWQQACLVERQDVEALGEAAVLQPFHSFIKQVQLKPARADLHQKKQLPDTDMAFCEYDAFIKPSRIRTVGNDPVALRYQVKLHELALLIGVPSSEIRALVNSGAISPVNTTTVLRDQLFDLRALAKVVSKLKTPSACANEGGYLRISNKAKVFEQYLTTFSSLLGDALTGRINAYATENRSLSTIYVRKSDLNAWLNKQLSSACTSPVAVHVAARALRCGDKRVRELVQEGVLAWAKWSQNGERVDGRLLMNLLSQKAATKSQLEGHMHA